MPPIDLDFRHHFKEYYLNSFGYLLEDPEVTSFASLQLNSIAAGIVRGPAAACMLSEALRPPLCAAHAGH